MHSKGHRDKDPLEKQKEHSGSQSLVSPFMLGCLGYLLVWNWGLLILGMVNLNKDREADRPVTLGKCVLGLSPTQNGDSYKNIFLGNKKIRSDDCNLVGTLFA